MLKRQSRLDSLTLGGSQSKKKDNIELQMILKAIFPKMLRQFTDNKEKQCGETWPFMP